MSKHLKLLTVASLILVIVGMYFRFDKIAQNQFFFYDEGIYLNMQRGFDELVSTNQPTSLNETLKILRYNLFLSLCTAKPLWFFLFHLRSLWGHFDAFYITKILSAIFGSLTIIITFLFSYRFTRSKAIALLSVAVLAVLPSHVFYSRLGLQEALSTLCLLMGFYFYIIPNKFNGRTVLAGIFFALTYFSNYRMFVIPALVLVAEICLYLSEKQRFNVRRYVWSMVTFASIIIFLGLVNNGCHMRSVFIWMIRQAGSAQGHFHLINLLSYPYMLYRLESVLFALFFFSGAVFVFKRQWRLALPFMVIIFQMAIFSFAHEKGARYLCVVLPFMAVSVALSIHYFYRLASERRKFIGGLVVVLVIAMSVQHLLRANAIRSFNSDYQVVMEDISKKESKTKLISTQAAIQGLFSPKKENVVEPPHRFVDFVAYFQNEYQYMMLGPQAYISYTNSGLRFDPPLEDHLQFIVNQIEPVRVYEHFSDAMMERFVFEHNEHLPRSIHFLKINENSRFNKLRLYRTEDYVEEVLKRLQRKAG